MVQVNRWSFVSSIVCILLFWLADFSHMKSEMIRAIGVNPWCIVLFGSLITLVFGVTGFAGGRDWLLE